VTLTKSTTRKTAAKATPVKRATKSVSAAKKAPAKKPTTRTKTTRTPRQPKNIVWTADGKPIESPMAYSLSRMAGHFSRGLNPDGSPRLGVQAFAALLATNYGIIDPHAKSWDIVLPNGHRIGAVVDGKPAPKLSAADLTRAESAKSVKRSRGTGTSRARRGTAEADAQSAAAKAAAERASAAMNENRAEKAWIAGGRKGKRPPTPNRDAIDAEKAAKVQKSIGAAKKAVSVKAPARRNGRSSVKAA